MEKLTDSPSQLQVRHLRFYYPYYKKRTGSRKGHITLNWSYGGQAGNTGGKALINPSSYPTPNFNWNAVVIPRYFTRPWILGTSSDASDDYPILKNQNNASVAMDLFKANPNQLLAPAADAAQDTYINSRPNATSPAVTDGQLQINTPQQYLTIHSVDETIQIKSFTSIPQTVQIYWFMCDADTTYHPLNEWYDAMGRRQFYQLAVTPSAGNNKAGFVGDPALIPNLSLKGYKSVFNDWHIFYAESFILQQSEEVKFLIKHKVNRTMKYENVASSSAATNVYIKGLSICPVVIVNGGLAKTSNEGVPTGTTTSETSIGSVTTRSMKISFPEYTAKYAYDASHLRLDISATKANLYEISEEGALVNEVAF